MHFQHSSGIWRDFRALVPGVLYVDQAGRARFTFGP